MLTRIYIIYDIYIYKRLTHKQNMNFIYLWRQYKWFRACALFRCLCKSRKHKGSVWFSYFIHISISLPKYFQCREIGFEIHEEVLKVLHELHTAMKTHHTYQSEFRQAESKLQVNHFVSPSRKIS